MIGLPKTVIMPTVIKVVNMLRNIHPALAVLFYVGLVALTIFLIRCLLKMGDSKDE